MVLLEGVCRAFGRSRRVSAGLRVEHGMGA